MHKLSIKYINKTNNFVLLNKKNNIIIEVNLKIKNNKFYSNNINLYFLCVKYFSLFGIIPIYNHKEF